MAFFRKWAHQGLDIHHTYQHCNKAHPGELLLYPEMVYKIWGKCGIVHVDLINSLQTVVRKLDKKLRHIINSTVVIIYTKFSY